MAEDRIVLDDAAWQFGLSSFVLGHFFFLGVGLGLSIKWAGVAKFNDPTIYILLKLYYLVLDAKITTKLLINMNYIDFFFFFLQSVHTKNLTKLFTLVDVGK